MAEFTVALDQSGKRIHITNAPHGKYKCIHCGQDMMAVLGDEKEHHFRHAFPNNSCDHDTWLHTTLVDLLYQRVTHEASVQVEKEGQLVEIAKGYDAQKEKTFCGVRPDILLKADASILLEVFWTHQVTKKKVGLGYRIIEIEAFGDGAIEELEHGTIKQAGKYYKLNFYNWHSKPKVAESPSPGSPTIHYILFKNGSHIVEYSSSTERLYDDAKLELGMTTIADFAENIGNCYAAKLGYISPEYISESELSIDLNSVIQSFNVREL